MNLAVIPSAVAARKVSADDTAALRAHLIGQLFAKDEHVVLQVRMVVYDAAVDNGDHRLRRSRAMTPDFGGLYRRWTPLPRPQRIVRDLSRLAAHDVVRHRADDIGVFLQARDEFLRTLTLRGTQVRHGETSASGGARAPRLRGGGWRFLYRTEQLYHAAAGPRRGGGGRRPHILFREGSHATDKRRSAPYHDDRLTLGIFRFLHGPCSAGENSQRQNNNKYDEKVFAFHNQPNPFTNK